MRVRARRVLIAGGALCVAGAFMLRIMVNERSTVIATMRQAREVAALGGQVSQAADGTLYLPNIIARSDPLGVVVTLQNDSLDRTLLLDSAKDRLTLNYESVAFGHVVRHVSVATGKLAPGETGAPVTVSIDGRWRGMTIQFEHRDNDGGPQLVARTEVEVP